MRPLFNELEFKLAKTTDDLSCECYTCGSKFLIKKREIISYLNNGKGKCNYCSRKCSNIAIKKSSIIKCDNCCKSFEKQLSQINKSKNHFCSSSCAATYNNTHKTKGNRRSKLETYLENELIKYYPDLEIHFNRKDAINSELDIYIPSLKLAFELNGIFHYEPIFGVDKYNQIQNNDNRKFQACLEQGIEICIIDSSQQKYFKKETSQKYLDIITNIINNKK